MIKNYTKARLHFRHGSFTWERNQLKQQMSQLEHEEQNSQQLAYPDYNQSSRSFQSAWNRDIADYVQRQRGTAYNAECSQKAYAVSLIGPFILICSYCSTLVTTYTTISKQVSNGEGDQVVSRV